MSKKTIIAFILGLFIVLGLFVYYLSSYCYTMNYLLLRQYIGATNDTKGGSCTDGCLMMDVVPIKSSYILSFVENPPQNKYQQQLLEDSKITLYFSNEHKLINNLNQYSQIRARWCKTRYGYRIREVKEVDEE